MSFCRKCGARLKEDDVFCFKCGEPIDKTADEVFADDQVPSQELPVMTKEESIDLALKLKDKYASIEKLEREIGSNETTLKRPAVISHKRYSKFRFFWPFLIYAYITLNVVYLIGVLISSTGDDAGVGVVFSLIIAFMAAIGLLILGNALAGRKQERLNAAIAEEEYKMKKRIDDLAKNTAELKTKLKMKKNEVSEYTSLVPPKLRTKIYMDKIITLISTGKAESFYDAVNMLK